jgi:hypothetical protein
VLVMLGSEGKWRVRRGRSYWDREVVVGFA